MRAHHTPFFIENLLAIILERGQDFNAFYRREKKCGIFLFVMFILSCDVSYIARGFIYFYREDILRYCMGVEV